MPRKNTDGLRMDAARQIDYYISGWFASNQIPPQLFACPLSLFLSPSRLSGPDTPAPFLRPRK